MKWDEKEQQVDHLSNVINGVALGNNEAGVLDTHNTPREKNGSTIETRSVENGEDLFAVKSIRQGDQYDVDFEDTRPFSKERWIDIINATTAKLSVEEQEMATDYPDWQDLAAEIQAKLSDPASTTVMKRQMGRIQPLPQTLFQLTRIFSKLLLPYEVNYDIIWGLIYLNLKLSYASPERLKRTSNLLHKLKRTIELFVQCLAICDKENEARIAVVDFLDPMTIILTDSVAYLQKCSSDSEADEAWPALSENINAHMLLLDQTVKHVSDMTSYSKVNQDRKIKNMSQRHAFTQESDEPGHFPNRVLPDRENHRFYGRQEELEKIYKYLSPKDDLSLRTYLIYGRRGIGKTEIALKFAHSRTAEFDAIFWIQCETSVAIRQSFTDVAVSLNLPKADKDGHHEENLLAVHDWLKKTNKRWLMIFDNAENDTILKGYWPVGASGAILITSRKYHNFQKDLTRQGITIKPFDIKQSWELLLELLGDDWKKADREGKIEFSEVAAAKSLLEKLEGLALAIQQAAILIKDPNIGGPTIAKTLDMLRERMRTLPERHSTPRTLSEKPLDALWDITFNCLSKNARVLLRVFAWLSPDSIPMDLFLPQNQKILEGSLAFCKQASRYIDAQNQASLSSLVSGSTEFEKAIKELLDMELIRQSGRYFAIHRVIQEATSFHNLEDLQDSFESASRLVYEMFPKLLTNESLYSQWSACQIYIAHGVHISKKFSDNARSGVLKPSNSFIKLLSNCGWYLYEIGDYDVSGRVLDTAAQSCEEKRSLLFAEIRNSAGSRFFDLNRLADCRIAWEDTLRVRKDLLPHNAIPVAQIYHNLGNLELATGQVEDSSEYYQRALQIWQSIGNEAASHLALTYLCLGRVEMLRGDLNKAMKITTQSETLFARTLGSDQALMGYNHYLAGNIHFLQKHWVPAWQSYDKCLKIALAQMPIHPLTAAAYYSLACVEFAQGHPDNAKGFLDKAKTIAELRSPNRDDGPIARILWKTAVVLESDPVGRNLEEATDLRKRAAVAKTELLGSGEGGGEIPFLDDDDNERDQEEDSYDALVPLFFR